MNPKKHSTLIILICSIGFLLSSFESYGKRKDITILQKVPFQYEIIQDEMEPYWIKIVKDKTTQQAEALALNNEYIIQEGANAEFKRGVIRQIGDSAYMSASIRSLNLPPTVTEIGEYAFAGTQLEKINLNDGLKIIGKGAFSGLTGTEPFHLVIPESVEFIDSYAFYHCLNLYSIKLPATLTRLNGYTFPYCESLNTIICLATTPPIADTTDFNCNWYGPWIPIESISDREIDFNNCFLYVPEESVELYRNAPGWSLFKHIKPLGK